MSSEFDRQHLISIFVLEASDGMAVLTQALRSPADDLPAPQQLAEQFIVAHRVRGAAALYGYNGVARLAERLEALLEQAPSIPVGQWPQAVEDMRTLTQAVQAIVRSIGQGGSEDEELIERCLASTRAVGDTALAPDLAAPEYVLPPLDDEVLSYFQPEAEEYLSAIAELIQILRHDKHDEGAIERLFRTVHTLKGSAYTVEFQVVGDVAHPMEDCMIAIRTHCLLLTDDLLDMIARAVGFVRLILQRNPAHVPQLQQDIPRFIHALSQWPDEKKPKSSSVTDRSVGQGETASPVVQETSGVGTAPPIDLSDAYLFPKLDAEVLSYFVPEVQEYLETLEANLLQLDKDAQNRELINQVFRTAHTLKGSAYTVGFRAIGDLIHHVEDFMGAVRDERFTVEPGHTDVILRTIDVVRALVQRDLSVSARTRERFDAARSELKRLESSSAPEPVPSSPWDRTLSHGEHLQTDTEEVQEHDHGTEEKAAENREVIRVSHARLERLMNLVGELVTGRGRLEQRLRVLEQLSQQVLVFKARLVDSIQSFSDKHMFTYQEAPVSQQESVGLGGAGFGDFGSLELDKYDDFNILARRIGEVTADISESMSQLDGSIRKAHDDMSQLQQLSLLMRDEIAHARMVAIGTPFTRFRRAIRETARALNKDVSLVTSGEHTEVDTGVVERLVDPLVHLVRNAVYHGIERSAERIAKGKPAVGTVYLHAAHRGNSVVIEVEDDGSGIDVRRIRDKAVQMGLVRPEQLQQMSDAEALQLIFLPGFSTADQVGEQAGRGVGLDVVKRVIEGMNGHIDIESELGAGTKFTLHIPLTLLITTALLVRVGSERYAIPLPSIVEVTIPTVSSLQQREERIELRWGDQIIQVQSLHHLLRRESGRVDETMPIVIVKTAVGPVGLGVDELLGRQEIVVKSLGPLKPLQQSFFGGATIDPEGRVILVIDPSRVFSGDTKVSVTVASVSKAEMLSQDSPPEDTPLRDPHQIRLLLVDDSLSIRKFVGRMLESAGYQLDTAVDGEDGLRKASTNRYTLIITDLEMPKLNGFEVIQALRSRPDTRHTPVLVMTTRAGDKHHHMAINVGATAYIAKPVEERILLQEIERWVGRAPVLRK